MKQRGFTLIELVIVVAIVGILASAALPLARWGAKRNREYALQQNLRILRNAIDRYHDAAAAGLIDVPEGTSGYPPTLEALVEGVPLLGQMPPVMPGASDEYGATGPGLTGGLGAQLQAGQRGAGGPGGAAAPAGGAPGGMAGPGTGLPGTGPSGTAASGPGTGGLRSGLSLGVNIGAQAGSSPAGQGSLLSAAFGQGQGAQAGAVGQLATGAGEPLVGPDGNPVLVMFLRRIPLDPMTGKAEWGFRCYGEPPTDRLWCGRDVFDVYSKALSGAINGTKYRDW